jgi:hypothetical protein
MDITTAALLDRKNCYIAKMNDEEIDLKAPKCYNTSYKLGEWD